MSEITTDFTLLFDDQDALEFAHKGFLLAHEGKNKDAITYFKVKNIALWFNDDDSAWSLDSYERDGSYLKGFISSGTISFDEEDFMQSMAEIGAKYSIANIYNTQVGEGYGLAFKGRKKSSPQQVLKELAKVDPTYALGIAIEKERAKEAVKFIQEGANPNGSTARRPFIEIAAENGMFTVVKALLESGANPSAQAPSLYNSEFDYYSGGETALHHAAESYTGSKLLKLLLEHKANPNVQDSNGNTPLHTCTLADDHRKYIETLLTSGADIDAKNNNGMTPLLYLLNEGTEDEETRSKQKAVKCFIEHGADLHAKCNHGGNALWYAAGETAIEKYIKKSGITDLEAPDNAYNGHLEYDMDLAILHNDMSQFTQLITACADADETMLADYLVSTAWYNRFDMAEKLVALGANPYAKNKSGMQAFRIAKDNGFSKLSDYLRSVSITDIEHEEALFDSVKSIVEELIDALNNYKEDESNREKVKTFFTKDNLDRFSGDKEAENNYFKILTSTVRRISRNQVYVLKDDETVELTISSTISSNFELKFKKIDGCFKIISNY